MHEQRRRTRTDSADNFPSEPTRRGITVTVFTRRLNCFYSCGRRLAVNGDYTAIVILPYRNRRVG
jgi:hypothetical protein